MHTGNSSLPPAVIMLSLLCRVGYNMIHFTPIQRLGNSNSAYSLSDQLKLNLAFTCEGGAEATLEDVATLGELNLFC